MKYYGKCPFHQNGSFTVRDIFYFMLFPLFSGIIMICQEFLLHVVNKNNLLAKGDPQRLPTSFGVRA